MKQHSYRVHTAETARGLSKVSLLATAVALGGDWALIGLACYLGTRMASSFPVTVGCWLLIASRQHALVVLMHEAAHGHLLSSRRANDWLGNLATAWPFFLSVERYRDHHWKHHQFTNTERDPDWGRKITVPAWQFPKTKTRFWRDFLPYAWGLGARELWFARKVIGVDRSVAARAMPFYAITALTLTLLGGWAVWAKFWLVPMLVVLPVLMKVRSVVEHLALPNKGELTASRNILGSPVEAFFFGPHGNALHLIHHLYPQVPWHSQKALREALLEDENFRKGAHENRGYFLPFTTAVYRDLVRGAEAAHSQGQRAA